MDVWTVSTKNTVSQTTTLQNNKKTEFFSFRSIRAGYSFFAWGKGVIALTKSVRPERMTENIAIYDFKLSTEDIVKIEALDMEESAIFDHDDP